MFLYLDLVIRPGTPLFTNYSRKVSRNPEIVYREACSSRGKWRQLRGDFVVRLPVQPAEVGLPSRGNTGQHNGLVHSRNDGKCSGGDGRPEHPAADEGLGHGDLNTLPNLVSAVTGEKALHGEVVGAKDRGVEQPG